MHARGSCEGATAPGVGCMLVCLTRAAVEEEVPGIIGHTNVGNHFFDQLVHYRCGLEREGAGASVHNVSTTPQR